MIILKNSYDAKSFNADFSQKIKTKLWIDKWVSDNTNKMINKLDTELSEDALMVLLDAIYMNGKWSSPFEIDQTEVDTFHNSDGTECDVAMMFQEIEEENMRKRSDTKLSNCHIRIVEYSMVVVLPKEKSSIETVMATTDWLDFDSDGDEFSYLCLVLILTTLLSFKDMSVRAWP